MSVYYVGVIPYSSELYHHGIKGQRWGVRRFQNPDGSLTPAGRARYGGSDSIHDKITKKINREVYNRDRVSDRYNAKAERLEQRGASEKRIAKARAKGEKFANDSEMLLKMKEKYMSSDEEYRNKIKRGQTVANALTAASIVAGNVLGDRLIPKLGKTRINTTVVSDNMPMMVGGFDPRTGRPLSVVHNPVSGAPKGNPQTIYIGNRLVPGTLTVPTKSNLNRLASSTVGAGAGAIANKLAGDRLGIGKLQADTYREMSEDEKRKYEKSVSGYSRRKARKG